MFFKHMVNLVWKLEFSYNPNNPLTVHITGVQVTLTWPWPMTEVTSLVSDDLDSVWRSQAWNQCDLVPWQSIVSDDLGSVWRSQAWSQGGDGGEMGGRGHTPKAQAAEGTAVCLGGKAKVTVRAWSWNIDKYKEAVTSLVSGMCLLNS